MRLIVLILLTFGAATSWSAESPSPRPPRVGCAELLDTGKIWRLIERARDTRVPVSVHFYQTGWARLTGVRQAPRNAMGRVHGWVLETHTTMLGSRWVLVRHDTGATWIRRGQIQAVEVLAERADFWIKDEVSKEVAQELFGALQKKSWVDVIVSGKRYRRVMLLSVRPMPTSNVVALDAARANGKRFYWSLKDIEAIVPQPLE